MKLVELFENVIDISAQLQDKRNADYSKKYGTDRFQQESAIEDEINEQLHSIRSNLSANAYVMRSPLLVRIEREFGISPIDALMRSLPYKQPETMVQRIALDIATANQIQLISALESDITRMDALRPLANNSVAPYDYTKVITGFQKELKRWIKELSSLESPLTETKIHKANNMNGFEYSIFEMPSHKKLLLMYQKYKTLRGLVSNGIFYWWDAYSSIHEISKDNLGLETSDNFYVKKCPILLDGRPCVVARYYGEMYQHELLSYPYAQACFEQVRDDHYDESVTVLKGFRQWLDNGITS